MLLRAIIIAVTTASLGCSSPSETCGTLPVSAGRYQGEAVPAATASAPSYKTGAPLDVQVNFAAGVVRVEYRRGAQVIVETWKINGKR